MVRTCLDTAGRQHRHKRHNTTAGSSIQAQPHRPLTEHHLQRRPVCSSHFGNSKELSEVVSPPAPAPVNKDPLTAKVSGNLYLSRSTQSRAADRRCLKGREAPWARVPADSSTAGGDAGVTAHHTPHSITSYGEELFQFGGNNLMLF